MIKNSAAMNMNISNFFCATMSFVIYNSIQQSNEDWKKKMAAERKQKSRLLQDQALVLKQSRESKQQSRAKLTPQEKQTINKKRRDARAILHSTESQHRRQERRTQEKLRVRLFRNKQASSTGPKKNATQRRDLKFFIKKAMRVAANHLHRSKYSDDPTIHRAPVCIICDCFVIGTERIRKLREWEIREHGHR
jgi:hypothetical protein